MEMWKEELGVRRKKVPLTFCNTTDLCPQKLEGLAYGTPQLENKSLKMFPQKGPLYHHILLRHFNLA